MYKVISKDGTAIAYDKVGTGFPVILVDGALCSREMGPMPKLASLLAKDFTVYHYDRRGRNDSNDIRPYSVEKEIEDIEAMIQAAGGQADLFGISSGAILGLVAASRGLPITKLALYEPPFAVDQSGHKAPKDAETQLKKLIEKNDRSGAVKFFLNDMVGAPVFLTWILRLTPFWSRLKKCAHTLPYDAAVLGDGSLPVGQISAIKIPTLVAGGAKSSAGLQSAVREVARIMNHPKSAMLKGQTHNVSASVLAPVLIEFFNNGSKLH